MNSLLDTAWGYWILCLMARRPLLVMPPKVTLLVSFFEGPSDEFELYLSSIGYELVLDDSEQTPARSKKFNEIEAFDAASTKIHPLPLPRIKKTKRAK